MPNKKIRLKARLILFNKGKILLLKQTKPNGGNYTLVGGNIEDDEYAKASLIRESFEEAGITLRAKDLKLVHTLQKNTAKEQRFVFYFKAMQYEGKAKSMEPDKFKAAVWFPLNKLPKNLTATVKHVMREHLKGRPYSEIKDEKKEVKREK